MNRAGEGTEQAMAAAGVPGPPGDLSSPHRASSTTRTATTGKQGKTEVSSIDRPPLLIEGATDCSQGWSQRNPWNTTLECRSPGGATDNGQLLARSPLRGYGHYS